MKGSASVELAFQNHLEYTRLCGGYLSILLPFVKWFRRTKFLNKQPGR